MDKQTAKMSCIASATRHTAPIGSVAISQSSKFFVSVSQDSCLKLWNLPNNIEFKGKYKVCLCHKLLVILCNLCYFNIILLALLHVINVCRCRLFKCYSYNIGSSKRY